MKGVINALKPPGMTSHDVVSFLRKLLQLKKIGHSGFDPAAGFLVSRKGHKGHRILCGRRQRI